MASKEAPKELEEIPEMRLEWRDPRTLQPHPHNFRRHSSVQRTAFAEFLSDVGWVAPLMFNERTGRLVDGHMRREEAIERNLETVPVVVVNLPPDREAEVLYFFDRIGSMAGTDNELEAKLSAEFATEQESLAMLLAGQQPPEDLIDVVQPGPDDLRGVSLVPGEAFNYVVLLFRTELDWLAAQDHFGLEAVSDPFKGTGRAGIGRIVDGSAYLKKHQ